MVKKQGSEGYGSALNKALTVMELVTAHPQAVGLPELTAKIGLPRQSVHRILRQLEEQGLLIRDPANDRFSVGPRLSRLAIAALFSENHHLPTRAELTDVVKRTGESCNIGVLDGLDFVYLDRIETEQALRFHLEAGTHVPAHCTSGGKVLLAHLPELVRRDLLRSVKLKRYSDNTIIDPNGLEEELAEIRERGYSTNDEEWVAGVVGVAVPVVDSTGRAIAALACHAPVARTSLAKLESFVPIITKTARSLGRYWA